MHKILAFIVLTFIGSAEAQTIDFRSGGITVKSFAWEDFKPMLATQTDTIYVVNFWATWCAPCVRELPEFERLQLAYADRKVKVLLVSLDMRKQIVSALIPFIKKRSVKAAVLHLYEPDANAWIGQVDPLWSGALPATLIFSSGNRKFYERSFTYEELEHELQPFIR